MPLLNQPIQYLRVLGRLYPDRQLVLRQGYLTENPPWSDWEGEGPLRAETFADDGTSLGSFPVRLYDQCREGGSQQGPQAVRAFVPFHPQARRVVFSYDGRQLAEVERHPSPPRVELTWRPEDGMSGPQTVTWTADHPDGADIEFFLRYSRDGGETWNRVSTRTGELSQQVDLDDLPGGERCLLAVVATDGVNTTTAASEPFALPPRPCQAIILHPVDGGTYAPGMPIPLAGQGFWREHQRPEREALEWRTSANDEVLGRGARVEVTLPPGRHVITLLTGDHDNRGRADVTITVVDEQA